MLKELDDYDWSNVFGEGGEWTSHNVPPLHPQLIPGDDKTSGSTFGREDVETIKGISEGEKDERSWIIWGQLKDGRWFFAEGHCDYTGWDCQAGNDSAVASSEDDLIRLLMTNENRERFGLVLQ